jgi:hypothetical protein
MALKSQAIFALSIFSIRFARAIFLQDPLNMNRR